MLFQGKGNKHATLVDQFAYPIGGTGTVYESMQEQIQSPWRSGSVKYWCGKGDYLWWNCPIVATGKWRNQ